MTSLVPTMWPLLNLYPILKIDRLISYCSLISADVSTDTNIWRVYFKRQVMLVTFEHLITPLFYVQVCVSSFRHCQCLNELRVRILQFGYFNYFTI